MAVPGRGPAVLEQKLGAVGHFVPDGGQLVLGGFRVSLDPRDEPIELDPQLVHLAEVQQIRADHGHEHGVGLVDRIAPGGRVDVGRHDLLERVDGGNDVRYAVGNSLAIPCSPALERQVQSAPGRAAPRARRRSRIAGRNGLAMFASLLGPVGFSFPLGTPKIVEPEPARRMAKPVVLAAMRRWHVHIPDARRSQVTWLSVRSTPHLHSTHLGRECPSSYPGVGGRSARRPLGARQPRLLALIVRTVVEEELAPIAQCIRCSAPLLC